MYSEETATLIDTETRRILMEMEVRCSALLEQKRGALNLIARSLLEHETVSGEEVLRLIALAENNPAAASIEPETLDEANIGPFSAPSPGDPLSSAVVRDTTEGS